MGVTGQVLFIDHLDFEQHVVITELLHIMVIFLQLFMELMDLDDTIMRFRRRAVPQRRKRRAFADREV